MKESVRLHQNEVLASLTSSVWMFVDEVFTAILHPPSWLEASLTFKVKSLELVKGRRKSVWTNRPEYVLDTIDGFPCLVTHQGFAPRVRTELEAKGFHVREIDCRVPGLLPEPRLDLMRGFRFSQEELTTQTLLARRSGRVALPTRFGKTFVMINIIRAYPGVKIVILAPGADLVRQLVTDLKAALGPEGREIKQIGGGSTTRFMSEDITVCSMDSTHKLDLESIRLLICDEIHALPSPSRQDILLDMPLAMKIGMTASMTGRFDQRDYLLEGLFGPVLAHRTYTEATQEKAVEQITAIMIDWPVAVSAADARYMDRDAAMPFVQQSEKMARCVRWLANEMLPADWQTLFFIQTEAHANFLLDAIGSETAVAMAKLLTTKQRKILTEKVRHNHISRAICSNIFVQGVTFHDIMALVNCALGGASTTTIQKPGRLAEVREEKIGALMIDFYVRPADKVTESASGIMQLWRESQARQKSYEDTGYITKVVRAGDLVQALVDTGISFRGSKIVKK